MRLVRIGIHPVKSTAIRRLDEAVVQRWGLAGDRRWMVVDADGVTVTARELHELFRIVADTIETAPGLPVPLRLSAAGHEPIDVPQPDTEARPVRLFTEQLLARPAGRKVSEWIAAVVGRRDLSLVWCDDPTRRALNPEYSRLGDHTAFADGYPVTIASVSSLAQLNDWMAQGALERGEDVPAPLPMDRFRPSLVIEGAEPFAEDTWARIRIGEVVLRRAKPIDRCVMATISLADLTTGKEPIRTLARHRLAEHKVLFAIHTIPEHTGTIRVGDRVEVS